MKITKLQEANSSLTPYEKMDLFNQGKRRENIKACKTSKLVVFYKICLDNNFTLAQMQIETELMSRQHTAYLLPRASMISSSHFQVNDAKFVLANANTPNEVIYEAAAKPKPGLTISETETVYLMLALVLGVDSVVNTIKTTMRAYNTFYDHMPKVLNELLAQPDIDTCLSAIAKQV